MHTQNLDISVLNKSIEGILNAYSKDIKVKTFPEELSKKYILKISKTIEDLYKTKGNDPYFRSSFENFLIELMETEGVEEIKILFYTLPIRTSIKKEVLKDLEEAIQTFKLKRELKKVNLTGVLKSAISRM